MKRILLAIIILFAAGIVYAQQASQGANPPPTSNQVKQSAQQLSAQAKSNSSQFESILAELSSRNVGNQDVDAFNKLKAEIEHLESAITREENRIRTLLDSGKKTSPGLVNRIERLINQHKAVIVQLDAFIAR